MDHSTTPISASSASALISNDIASTIKHPHKQQTNSLGIHTPISDTLETQDRESDGSSTWEASVEKTTSEDKSGTSTGDFLDLRG